VSALVAVPTPGVEQLGAVGALQRKLYRAAKADPDDGSKRSMTRSTAGTSWGGRGSRCAATPSGQASIRGLSIDHDRRRGPLPHEHEAQRLCTLSPALTRRVLTLPASPSVADRGGGRRRQRHRPPGPRLWGAGPSGGT